jgi:hypothetical protein
MDLTIDQVMEKHRGSTDFMIGKRAFYDGVKFDTLLNDDQRNGWKRQEIEYGAWLADELADEY